ncbi:hypothetical protein DFH06DRAFT_1314286 [Mycena polygramma]|nr:hypothetical protein DFH06DRAFT_1314286 [Mycena polygramma]
MPRFMRFMHFLHASATLYVLRIACFGRRPIRRTHSLRSISGLVELDVLRHNCVPNCCRTLPTTSAFAQPEFCAAPTSPFGHPASPPSNFTVQGTITVTVGALCRVFAPS